VITVQKTGKMAVTATNGQHQIISDVGTAQGGEDAGLNPHELIEAALASCTTLTIELYAKRKNWDVSEMKVEVKIVQESKESSRIERKITFGPQNSAEEKQRMTEIANKCPIHNLLESKITIETTAQ
jgi:putative redox protein